MPLGNSNGSFVGVWLGGGDRTFAGTSAYPAGTDPESVVLGDLDGDGALDIVSVNAAASTLGVFRGRGDGGFAARLDFATGSSPKSPVLGDVNGDGKPDIVLISGDKVSVLLGQGDGAFGAHLDSAAGTGLHGLALGDVNGDDKLDVVTARSAPSDYGSVTILLGNGDGSFTSHVDYKASVNTKAVALGDLDGDGKLDAVVANLGMEDGGGPLTAMRGNGDGSFATLSSWLGGNAGPNSLVLSDVNRDGKLDIVVANTGIDEASDIPAGPSSVSVLLGKGDGTFPSTRLDATASWAGLALGDLDGDGQLDLVATNPNTGAVDVLLRACR